MDYKSLMGYGDKKKVTKKESKPKVNEVLNSIKEEFGYKEDIKEIGAAPQYKKFVKSIDKERDKVGRETLKFVDLLRKKGLTDAADDLLDSYKNNVIKFGLEVKKIIKKLL
tara:strand:- start:96 stop:428 length:333 start_codon:yes stop_codon:yes gene_type:complete